MSDSDALVRALDALVRPALVRIGAPDGGYDRDGDRFWGTGFFIAPGWVLTCAHVVAEGGGAVWRNEPAVGITWQDGRRTRQSVGTVVLALPRPEDPDVRPEPWGFPDVALVRVPGTHKASCVLLADRPPARTTEVGLHGWSRETGELGIRQVHGKLSGVDARALVTEGAMPVEGSSGGPVVDDLTGAVIGLNKGRWTHQGALVPLTDLRDLHDAPGGEHWAEALRAHDRHHLDHYLQSTDDRSDWTRAQRQFGDRRPLSPQLRTRLWGSSPRCPTRSTPARSWTWSTRSRPGSGTAPSRTRSRTTRAGGARAPPCCTGCARPTAPIRAIPASTPSSCTPPTSSGGSPAGPAVWATRPPSGTGSSTGPPTRARTSAARSTT
ncbi:trypsin-like peptidase domain-containing protein [Streptomyces diastatochromogenes]|nr:trypsin-like peptidase domain-containing protein [Streptomyces diastatochromogenes]